MNELSVNEMNPAREDPTRESLLERLRDLGDHEGWKVFFDLYWKLIYSAAMKAGLNDAEAQDVVQETVISVCRQIPGFEYDRKKGSFKVWLLRLTSWRIVDELRKRQSGIQHLAPDPGTSTETQGIERLPDPVDAGIRKVWDEEWEGTLLDGAMHRVKRRTDPKQYQVFYLYAVKKWPVSKVASTLKVSRGMVYLVKHRVGSAIKKEIARLRDKPL
jgi:RNA polymerase sigma factor (sigma-70 family)